MNIPAVKKLLAHLKKLKKTEQAARFNMNYWGHKYKKDLEYVLVKPVCNTQACLAGETVLALELGRVGKRGGILLNQKKLDIEDTAAIALDLTYEEKKNLFYLLQFGNGFGWPQQFENAYDAATTPVQRLQATINRVQHFLDTNGAE